MQVSVMSPEARRGAHLCDLLQQQRPPLHPPLHLLDLLLILLPALQLLLPAENTEKRSVSLSALQRPGSRRRPGVCQLPEFSEFALAGLGKSHVGVVGLGTFRHHLLQLLLPLPLLLLPALLLLLSLPPLLQNLSTQGESPVTWEGSDWSGREEGGGGRWRGGVGM